MAAEKFRASEDAYFNLRGQFDTGRITKEQFDENLRKLMVQDTQGHYWMPGADSGKWYFYDGSNWAPGDPFANALPGFAPLWTPADPYSPKTTDPESAYNAPSDGRGFLPVAFLIGAAVIILAVAGFFVFQNRDSIFGAQQLPAQITPIPTEPRTNLVPTYTSEPDFFNTSTPVPVLSSPSPAPVTFEPTAPLVIVIPTKPTTSSIPTITPAVLSTPVSQVPGPATLPSPPTGRLRVGNGPDARARYIPVSQFTLDGYLNEWIDDGVPLSVPHVGAENWVGPSDLSGSARLGWSENFLLIAVNVLDDAHVQTQRSWEMFRGDSVELWIDADLEGDFDVTAGNEDDYQFGFSPGDFAGLIPEGVLYLPYRDPLVNQQILVAAQPNSGGYTLEAAVPWAVLRARPGQGRVFGYMVDLSDNDVPATAQQQTQVNHNPNFQFKMPATFGNLILE